MVWDHGVKGVGEVEVAHIEAMSYIVTRLCLRRVTSSQLIMPYHNGKIPSSAILISAIFPIITTTIIKEIDSEVIGTCNTDYLLTITYLLLFPHNHKPHKNTFVLVDTDLKKPKIVGPSRDHLDHSQTISRCTYSNKRKHCPLFLIMYDEKFNLHVRTP